MTFEAGTIEKEVPVNIIDDRINELSHYFQAELSSPTDGLALGTYIISSVTITDNDGKQFSLVNIISVKLPYLQDIYHC